MLFRSYAERLALPSMFSSPALVTVAASVKYDLVAAELVGACGDGAGGRRGRRRARRGERERGRPLRQLSDEERITPKTPYGSHESACSIGSTNAAVLPDQSPRSPARRARRAPAGCTRPGWASAAQSPALPAGRPARGAGPAAPTRHLCARRPPRMSYAGGGSSLPLPPIGFAPTGARGVPPPRRDAFGPSCGMDDAKRAFFCICRATIAAKER